MREKTRAREEHPEGDERRRATTVVASAVAALIIGLNVFLVHQTFFG